MPPDHAAELALVTPAEVPRITLDPGRHASATTGSVAAVQATAVAAHQSTSWHSSKVGVHRSADVSAQDASLGLALRDPSRETGIAFLVEASPPQSERSLVKFINRDARQPRGAQL
jgi:hypothetical protein